MTTLNEIADMTIDLVPHATGRMIADWCERQGMSEGEYNKTPNDTLLPHFDRGYLYHFDTPNALFSIYEALESGKRVMQSGFQLIMPPKQMELVNTLFHEMNAHLLSRYTSNWPSPREDGECLNYRSSLTICYIAKDFLPEVSILTMRVGNKSIWSTESLCPIP